MRIYKAGDVVTLDIEIPIYYYGDTEDIIYPQEIILEDNEDNEEEFLVLKAKIRINYSDYPITMYFSRHGRCGLSSDFQDNPYLFNQI